MSDADKRSELKLGNLGKYTLPILAIALAGWLFISCSKDEKDPAAAQPPVFSVTPVDIVYDPSDSSYGDIVFIPPVITPFGYYLGNNRYMPGIEYFAVIGAPIRSVTDGIVDTIIENPIDGDYTVFVVCIPGSDYVVIYDHVLDPQVLVASALGPGEIIGLAGNFNLSMGRTIVQVTQGEGNNRRSICPLNFGNEAFNAAHEQLLSEYNRRFPPGYSSLCLLNIIGP